MLNELQTENSERLPNLMEYMAVSLWHACARVQHLTQNQYNCIERSAGNTCKTGVGEGAVTVIPRSWLPLVV